ncbi:MAG: DUF2867 domain-containing protein [Rhodoglobus sp.]|nr:DUF2867 domain-containing protein [Rhodoglobus sp.]
MTAPSFWSLALVDIPNPDYADMSIGVLPGGASVDPAVWARSMFSLRDMPRWIVLAMGARQLLVPLVGIPRAPREVFEVQRVEGGEALLGAYDKHLDFRVGVAVDQAHGLVRVVTTVRLKGWRGRLYFAPVRLAHPLVVHSMLRRSQRALARPDSGSTAPRAEVGDRP